MAGPDIRRPCAPTKPHPVLALACLLAGVLLADESASGGPAQRVFRAGAFAADITPTHLPISVNGGFQDRMADSVHDRLHARCLVLDDGTTRLALVICDSCMISRETFDEAKRLASQATGIPPDKMLMAATHAHSAPTAVSTGQSEPDPRYLDHLEGQIAEGVWQAFANLAPARIGPVAVTRRPAVSPFPRALTVTIIEAMIGPLKEHFRRPHSSEYPIPLTPFGGEVSSDL